MDVPKRARPAGAERFHVAGITDGWVPRLGPITVGEQPYLGPAFHDAKPVDVFIRRSDPAA
jgi:hypothetical protein